MKMREQMDPLQPDWVCRDCGGQWGLWWVDQIYSGPEQHCATFHSGKCGVCNKKVGVTEARDYGYLRKGWQNAQIPID